MPGSPSSASLDYVRSLDPGARQHLRGSMAVASTSGLARDASGIVYKIHAKSLKDLRRAEEIMYPQGAKNRRQKAR